MKHDSDVRIHNALTHAHLRIFDQMKPVICNILEFTCGLALGPRACKKSP